MGKRIIQQRRGRGGFTYRVKSKASLIRVGYPVNLDGEYKVVKLISSPGHSVPIAKLLNNKGEVFYYYAPNMLCVGQTIKFNGSQVGDIANLENIKNGTSIFNLEHKSKDGGKFIRTGGNSGIVMNRQGDTVTILMPSKKEKKFNINCRATIGVASGAGRLEKPILKAGIQYHIMRSKSKLWPRTSAIKMNRVDHPFGSGRGKRIKSKIAKRNSPPGKKVGLIRPRRTGRKKR